MQNISSKCHGTQVKSRLYRSSLLSGIMGHKLVSLVWIHVTYCPLLVQNAVQGADNGFNVVAPFSPKNYNPFSSLHNIFLMQTVNGVAGNDGGGVYFSWARSAYVWVVLWIWGRVKLDLKNCLGRWGYRHNSKFWFYMLIPMSIFISITPDYFKRAGTIISCIHELRLSFLH